MTVPSAAPSGRYPADDHGGTCARIIELGSGYEPQPATAERATAAMERQAAALERLADALERLAAEHGAPDLSEAPEDIARREQAIRWLTR